MKQVFKAFKVDHKIFARFDYPPFFKDDKPFYGGMYSQYKAGDVVYIKEENAAAVVLGSVDEQRQELRTDYSGNQCYSQIEFYNPQKHPTAYLTPSLKKEIDKKLINQ